MKAARFWMWLDPHMFVTLASGIALLAFAWQLLGIDIPDRNETAKLRTARVILAISYLILAIPPFAEFASGSMPDKDLIAVFTVGVAAFQSLLFTTTLLTLINPNYVTKRKVWIHIIAVSIAVAIYMTVALTTGKLWVYILASVAYMCQLTYYSIVFRRKYEESLKKLEEYYDEDEEKQLSWAKYGFLAALSVGVVAFISAWLSPAWYNVFTIGYTIFYGWFATRFINYVGRINFYLPAVLTLPASERASIDNTPVSGLSESEIKTEKEHLRIAIDRWINDLGFTHPDEGKEQIAQSLGTTKDFMNWYFNTEIKQDFRSWRINLRINYAKILMSKNEPMSMNDIARRVGYTTKSNFYGHFKKLTGETPVEYCSRLTKKNAADPSIASSGN